MEGRGGILRNSKGEIRNELLAPPHRVSSLLRRTCAIDRSIYKRFAVGGKEREREKKKPNQFNNANGGIRFSATYCIKTRYLQGDLFPLPRFFFCFLFHDIMLFSVHRVAAVLVKKTTVRVLRAVSTTKTFIYLFIIIVSLGRSDDDDDNPSIKY